MKRWLRFRISTMLFAIVIAAICCSMLLPFQPRVEFRGTQASSYADGFGNQIPSSIITLTNRGGLPLWYEGYDHVATFSFSGDPTVRVDENHWITFTHSPKFWSVLWPGNSVNIELPTPEDCSTAVVNV